MTEAQLQDAIRDLARLRGWLFFHPYDSRRSTPGWPDFFLLHPRTGQLVVAELKTARGRVSPAQHEWIAAFAAAGITVHVWRPEHLHNGEIAHALTPAPRRLPCDGRCGLVGVVHPARHTHPAGHPAVAHLTGGAR